MLHPDTDLLNNICGIARRAGEAIMEIYSKEFDTTYKKDNSPLTQADKAANKIIISELSALTPDIPVLSEESVLTDYEVRKHWRQFWLVDPLDGTKEFVNRNGEFTVNIALINHTIPVLGVVYAPVPDLLYSAVNGFGAFKQESGKAQYTIHTKKFPGGPVQLVASRTHAGDSLESGITRLEHEVGKVDIKSMGSSLKFCLLAEGAADVYPRLGPTAEWDTAAAQAIVNCAGGNVVDLNNNELRYNKVSILNPNFIVQGDTGFSWVKYFNG